MDNPFKSPVILSLCSGMCGLERGIERAIGELQITAYVEVESFIIENLLSLMEQGLLAPTPVWANLKTFPAKEFYGKIHGIIGGYPCQPFSVAGQRKGTDDPRHLWPYIQKLVSAIRPIWCFFENVPGHLTMGYDEVYRSLSDLGYKVECGIYSAEEVGAPHQRKRLFILAMENTYCESIRNNAERFYTETPSTSQELAFPNRFGHLYGQFEIHTTERRFNAFCDFATACGKVISDSRSAGLEGLWECGYEKGRQEQDGHFRSDCDLWPARPGECKYNWEEPRILTKKEFESSLGGAINGYNFREDLLRMYGNGVVEQTAEIAFIDLLRKHNL